MKFKQKLYDKDITPSDYGTFQNCSIRAEGKVFRFEYACGARYDVPIDYFVQWYYEPHYIRRGSRWIEWQRSKHKDVKKGRRLRLLFVRYRSLSGIWGIRAVKIFLNNGTAFLVPWDTVLMSCEKRYEHFGGLTKESRRIVNEYHESGRNCTEGSQS